MLGPIWITNADGSTEIDPEGRMMGTKSERDFFRVIAGGTKMYFRLSSGESARHSREHEMNLQARDRVRFISTEEPEIQSTQMPDCNFETFGVSSSLNWADSDSDDGWS